MFLSQPIPSALWLLPNLTALYLEGNGFTGSLDIGNFSMSTSTLQNVSVANNRLTGAVPSALQRYGRFLVLDLTYNKLSGGILPDIAMSSVGGATMTLSVNRLSGVYSG